MDTPSFSVIISVYNDDQPDWFDNAVKSILQQSAAPSELIFTQDGEINQSLSNVLQPYLNNSEIKTRLIQSPIQIGRGDLLKQAVEQASHELIAIMDSDDEAEANRFAEQLTVFQSQSVDVVGSWIYETQHSTDTIYALKTVPEQHQQILSYAKLRNPINQMTVMFKKSAVLAVGNYQALPLFEDYWLWCRLLHAGYLFYNIPQPLVRARAGNAMFLRRKGLSYAIKESRLFYRLYRLSFLNLRQYLLALILRIPVRFLPGFIFNRLYKTRLLRKPAN